MRRKVLQDFANVFCQRFVDLPSGYDLATFVHLGSGFYHLNIVSGACTRDGVPIPPLESCKEYKGWLHEQLTNRNIPLVSLRVSMEINMLVSDLRIKTSFGHVFASAFFECDCYSEIRTDEKKYVGHQRGAKAWGFDWYYQKLYGDPMNLAGAQLDS